MLIEGHAACVADRLVEFDDAIAPPDDLVEPCLINVNEFSPSTTTVSPVSEDCALAFIRDCFDLSDFIGQNVWFGVFFGSDSSVTYPG